MTPVLFSFDMCDQVFEGFATGKKWNGFDEVAVTREQFEKVMAWGGGEVGAEQDAEERRYAEADFAKGEHHALAGWTVYLIDPESLKLAKAFTELLRAELTAEQFADVKRRNSESTNPYACASHDVCDPNVTMEQAFIQVVGREPDSGADADLHRMNDAWDLARCLGMIEDQ